MNDKDKIELRQYCQQMLFDLSQDQQAVNLLVGASLALLNAVDDQQLEKALPALQTFENYAKAC